MSTPDQTLDDFLAILNSPGNPHYHDANYLMSNVFCPDNPSNHIPSVGLTDDGPSFSGTADVKELFTQLFTTFPDLALQPLGGKPRLYWDRSASPPGSIAIQARLSGTQKKKWFAQGHRHYSPPISDIHIPSGLQSMLLPACAVFTFYNDQIANLSIYFDRYRMWKQLS